MPLCIYCHKSRDDVTNVPQPLINIRFQLSHQLLPSHVQFLSKTLDLSQCLVMFVDCYLDIGKERLAIQANFLK